MFPSFSFGKDMINKWIDKIFERKCDVISYFSSLHVAEFLLKIKKLCFLSEASIVSADRMLSPIAEASWRPTECNFRLEQALWWPTECNFWLEQALWRPTECNSRLEQASWRPTECNSWLEQTSWRPTECNFRLEQASWRPTECNIQLRKYSVGRQSTISIGASILSADRVLLPIRDCLCRKWT